MSNGSKSTRYKRKDIRMLHAVKGQVGPRVLRRYWLLVVIALLGALVYFTQPTGWVTPVSARANDSVPSNSAYIPILILDE